MLSSAKAIATLPASDYDRAKKFYTEKVGLTLKQDSEGGATFTCGGGTEIFVYPSQFAGTNKATAATFEVEGDLEAEVAELKSKGVTFEEYDMPEIKTVNSIATWEGMKSAWFKDSEGNIISVGQYAKEGASESA